MRPERLGLGRAVEGRFAGEAFVETAGERVLVGAAVDRLAADLLGGEIGECARDLPGLCRGRPRLLGQPEVGEVGVSALVEEHVARLDVSMHKTSLVGCVERVRHLACDRERPLGRERPFPFEQRLQIASLDVPHGDEELTVVFARLEDRDDACVTQRCG